MGPDCQGRKVGGTSPRLVKPDGYRRGPRNRTARVWIAVGVVGLSPRGSLGCQPGSTSGVFQFSYFAYDSGPMSPLIFLPLMQNAALSVLPSMTFPVTSMITSPGS